MLRNCPTLSYVRHERSIALKSIGNREIVRSGRVVSLPPLPRLESRREQGLMISNDWQTSLIGTIRFAPIRIAISSIIKHDEFHDNLFSRSNIEVKLINCILFYFISQVKRFSSSISERQNPLASLILLIREIALKARRASRNVRTERGCIHLIEDR